MFESEWQSTHNDTTLHTVSSGTMLDSHRLSELLNVLIFC